MARPSAWIVYSAIATLIFFNAMIWIQKSDGQQARMAVLLSEKASQDLAIQMKAESERSDVEKMKAYSMLQVSGRKRVLTDVMNGGVNSNYANLYETLTAEVECPGKIRVGTIGDGGKWTCNPWSVPKDSVLFTFGLNNAITFEADWQKMLSDRSVIYAFDSAEQSTETKKLLSNVRGQSKKALISTETNPAEDKFTMIDLAKEYNLTDIEILKIDIEGAEKECLIPFLQKFPVCQMYIEMHGSASAHAKLIQKIAALKYRLFSYEVNGAAIAACEYSYIHETCIDKYGGHRIANFLDFTN